MSALLPIILVALHTGVAANRVPNFKLAPTCSVALSGRSACRSDEQEAKRSLQKDWNGFTHAQRRSCVDLSQLGGPPSYVELLTCLEMAKEATSLPPSDRLGDLKPGL